MKTLQKRQSSKGVFEGVVHFQRSLRKFTASGFLLYEIDFSLSRKSKRQPFSHLALLYKLQFKNTKSQVFMICRGLHFSLQKSKESHF